MCDATIRNAIPMVEFAQRLLHSAEEMQYLNTFEFVNDPDDVTWAPVGSDHPVFNLLGVEAFGKWLLASNRSREGSKMGFVDGARQELGNGSNRVLDSGVEINTEGLPCDVDTFPCMLVELLLGGVFLGCNPSDTLLN